MTGKLAGFTILKPSNAGCCIWLATKIPYFWTMTAEKTAHTTSLKHYEVEPFTIQSEYLDRKVFLDAYYPRNISQPSTMTLMLINDGQDMEKLGLAKMLDDLLDEGAITPILAIGIRCNEDRRLEYGTSDILDYNNRGSRARYHRKFVLQELIPYVRKYFFLPELKEIAFAGFSLGGLSAMDIAWKHPEIFSKVGVFSASFWWRTKDLNHGYDEATDRIMHRLIREGEYAPNLKFFISTGTLDETMDRNNNGIIDSIDDALGVIEELEKKGYSSGKDIEYLELEDGRHDVPTWALAMPYFLKWGWGVDAER
ncbi:MAG: alpha/beta hydrolase-fold protein [Bacteroidota bacterium]